MTLFAAQCTNYGKCESKSHRNAPRVSTCWEELILPNCCAGLYQVRLYCIVFKGVATNCIEREVEFIRTQTRLIPKFSFSSDLNHFISEMLENWEKNWTYRESYWNIQISGEFVTSRFSSGGGGATPTRRRRPRLYCIVTCDSCLDNNKDTYVGT